jgi:HNH endonuclease
LEASPLAARHWRSRLHQCQYRVITIDDRQYNASHLAWLYVHGEWPALELDHEDTDRSNDRIGNLREAQPVENRANTKPRSASGFKGVRLRRGRAEAGILSRGKGTYLGSFDTPEEAAAAYHARAVELYGEFARAA